MMATLFLAACGNEDPNHGFFDDGPESVMDDGANGHDNGVGEDTNVPVSACLPASPGSGPATINAGIPATMMTVNSTALNTMETGDSPIPSNPIGILARGMGDCGKVGVLWMDPNKAGGLTKKLYYNDITNAGGAAAMVAPEIVIDGFSPPIHNASLFYLTTCAPMVMRPTADGYMEFNPVMSGVWSGKIIKVATDAVVTGLSGLAAWQEADGTAVVIARATIDGVDKGLVGRRPNNASGSWTFRQFDMPASTELFAIRATADNTIHAVYTKTARPCDETCDLDLYYGRRGMDGQWVEETIQDSVWGNPDDQYATDASMVIDSRGEPVVAATYYTNVITGSVKSAELRVYGRDNGEWCHETVATEVDGYHGADGTDMTGIAPAVALDAAGRIHVVFQDKAQWHDDNNDANAIDGQIRYAIRTGKQWTASTILSQTGQSEQASPLFGALPSSLVISDDGSKVFVATATTEWDTDSIYPNEAAEMVFTAVVQTANVTLP